MDLAQSIKQYYFDNLQSLSPDKQFHFCSRLAAWQADHSAFEELAKLGSYMLPAANEGAGELIKGLMDKPQTGRRNAHDLRQPYFDKYPRLWGVHLALFRIRHLKFVYGVEALEQLFEHASRPELEKLADDLLADDEATRILSTFAVNYLYLYKQILLGDKNFIHPGHFIQISDGYNTADKKHLQLMMYLFTHCIIGDSNFYTQDINPKNRPAFRQMLKILENIIAENFQVINLDNKLEFLVCCRICGYETGLSEPIFNECRESLSDEGHFLVDKHNQNAQDSRQTIAGSEHRNVLFIMSSSLYRPHSTLLS
jgi:hypothetical protein